MYTQEADASLFTTDTARLCDYNITDDVLNSDTIGESKSKITQPMGIHLQSKHKYRNVLATPTSIIMILIMVITHFQRQIYHVIATRITKPLLVFT